jgi:hypothetical protein
MDSLLQSNDTSQQTTIENNVIVKVNKTGNIKTADKKESDSIKENKKMDNTTTEPKISKKEIETIIINIMSSENSGKKYTADATLINENNVPIYIVDIYEDGEWYGYLEVDANKGPEGTAETGYGFKGGAFKEEISENNSTILKDDDVEDLLDKELETNYTVEDVKYNITTFTQDNREFFNITLEGINKTSNKTVIGNVTMDALSGEIISMNITEIIKNNSKNQKIYSVDEAGDFIDIVYKGKEVSVRENYPYYSPQNDKVYYSQEEEAEDLIRLYEDFVCISELGHLGRNRKNSC